MDLIPYVTICGPSTHPADLSAATAISGEKSHTCCATSHHTYALLSGRDKPVAVATSLYDSRLLFPGYDRGLSSEAGALVVLLSMSIRTSDMLIVISAGVASNARYTGSSDGVRKWGFLVWSASTAVQASWLMTAAETPWYRHSTLFTVMGKSSKPLLQPHYA